VPDLNARTVVRYELNGEARGPDGFTVEFSCDDSLRSWRQIVRWNLHYRHWGVLLGRNVPDLFAKVIWRKLWRRS
jgi:hypothetical protein